MPELTELQYRRMLLASRTVDRHLAARFDRAAAADSRLTEDEVLAKVAAGTDVDLHHLIPPRR